MINNFKYEYTFLNDSCPCMIKLGSVTYNSVRSAYDAFHLKKDKRKPFEGLSATVADKLLKACKETGFKDFAPGFEDRKNEVMYFIQKAKFSQNEGFKKLLLSTENEQIRFDNTKDTYWGVVAGKGDNNLGKILMRVREEIREAEK